MAKPHIHAASSATRFGGVLEDYIKIHAWFDSTKAVMADVRHRAILHSAFGIFLAEQVHGYSIVNSRGKSVSVRDVGEQHVFEDLGFIPSMGQWLQELPMRPWMLGRRDMPKPKETVRDLDITVMVNDICYAVRDWNSSKVRSMEEYRAKAAELAQLMSDYVPTTQEVVDDSDK